MPDSELKTSTGAGPAREPGGASTHDSHGSPDEIELGWYVRALRDRWKLLLVGAVLGAVMGVAPTYLRPTFYEASTTLLVVPSQEPSALPLNPATFRAILVNATVAQQIVDELALRNPPHNLTPQLFLERVNVEQVAATNVVRLRVALRDPDLAADAARRLAQKALVLAEELNQAEVASAQKPLNSRLAETSARMATAETELLAYQQRAHVELLEEDMRAVVKERGRKLGEAELSRLNELYARQSELARLQANFKLAKKIHSDLVVHYETIQSRAASNGPQLRLVDRAVSPDRPISAGRRRPLLLGVIAGALAAGLVALWLEGRQLRKSGNQARQV